MVTHVANEAILYVASNLIRTEEVTSENKKRHMSAAN